jgi:hypothetical protein
MPTIPLSRALADQNLFASHFRNKSWAGWKVFLRALFAEAPDEAGLAVYRERTGRMAWPAEPFTEAAVIVGRRGGKSRILALVAVYLACFRDYAPYLAPGEVATIGVLAVDKGQARAIFRFVHGLLKAVPMLEPLIVRRDTETIELSNRVVIEIATASFRSTRGYSYAAVLCDEVAFWRSDETSLNPDVEILRALRPGLATIPGAVLLIASSPYSQRGELYNAFRKHFGKDDARVLVWKASTQEMNPGIDRRIIDEAYEDDPESAKAEYGAEFRTDLADYISRETVEAVTMWGRHELPPEPGVTYSAFVDPAGGGSDSMTLAIGHLGRNNACILDAAFEERGPLKDPEAVVAQFATMLRRYGVAKIIGDRYAGEWPRARFAEHGIEFEQSARPKSDLFHDLLPLLNARRVELLDLPRLSAQLCALERRTARSGKDSIDHGPGGHDDLANAVAGLLVGVDLDRRQPLVKLADVFAVDGEGATVAMALPRHVGLMTFAVVVMEGADVAVVYAAHLKMQPPLYILDVAAGPLWRDFFTDTSARLDELRRACLAHAAAVFAPTDLLPLFAEGARRMGLLAQAPPDWFDAERSLAFAAGVVARQLVRFCAPVAAKMATQTIGAALAFKAGDASEMALRTAFIQAIGLKYDDQLTSRPRARAG